MISVDDYLVYVDQTLDGMIAVVGDLGDDLANRRPDVPGTNTPYALLTHCLGVMEFWGGCMVAGRAIERDRDAEFRASGPVAPLLERARDQRRRFEADLADVDLGASPEVPVDAEDADRPFGTSKGGVLIHVYEELSQHYGQMESIRDVLRAPWARLASV